MFDLLMILASVSVPDGDIRPLLRAQGFEIPINGRETIQYAGQIVQRDGQYQVYTYHGVNRAAVVDHGVNKIIVIRNGRTLVGYYNLSMPTKCAARGQAVLCADGVIRFTKSGPPLKTSFGKDFLEMEMASRFRK